MRTLSRTVLVCVLFFSPAYLLARRADPPRTTAETSDYKATSRHEEVVAFCKALAKESPLVRLGSLGRSLQGRDLPLLILADPPVATAEEASRSKKLIVFAFANIHAGEVDGKEALLMLARDLALAKDRPLLKDLVIVFGPIFNADGNELFARNRPRQAGPELVGTRANAQKLDLNRDYVKLESPEVRALVRFLNKWDPAVVIDCHTTNGSHHRYTLTYEGGNCPAGDNKVIRLVRDEMLPDITRRMEKSSGYRSFFYGNFSPDRSRWETVPPLPRYGTHYFGLRNRISILSESYSLAPFKDRVGASKAFVQTICEYTAEHGKKLQKLLAEARAATIKAGQNPGEKDTIVLRQKPAVLGRPVNFLGFVEETRDGRRVSTGKPKTYEVQYMGASTPTLSVRLPYAYLFPVRLAGIVENLQRHGIAVEELREDVELDVEAYRIDHITRATPFQKHALVSVDASARKESRRVPAGTIVIRTGQALGNLAAYLLEPQSADGLTTWNFFDAVLEEKKDFPVLRLPAKRALHTARVRPLSEERTMNKPITFDTLYAGRPPNFRGTPVVGLTWLDDGQHYLQWKDGQLHKVDALSGRSAPFFDPQKLPAGLARLPAVGARAARRLSAGSLHMNPARTGALFTRGSDLYYCNLDGTGAVRLTHTPGTKELPSFSPDGKLVAFVRDNNLFVVDIATQTERALTTDGSAVILNGKADWVYFEEIYLRSRQAFWWSPDSSRIVFLRFDDTPVHKYTLADPTALLQKLEAIPYPKAGAPNPFVKLGVVTAAGGPVQWANLGGYSETASLIVRAGWTPDSQKVFFYVQDRAQSWLDVCLMPKSGGESTRLFRETTRAWVDDPGAPRFLKDGSFLLASERTGWKHHYHFAADGKLKGPITSGPWEARTLHEVDESAGWVYFSGTRDSHLATNLYRVKLDGTGLQRLTTEPGDHRVNIDPKGGFFIDSWSNHQTPVRVRLYRTDGTLARTLDTNPVYMIEEYLRGAYEMVQIPANDGFVLEASILKPPTFDPKRRYPVWLMTYAGPHAPTIHDNWGTGRLRDEMLAQMGFIVFHCDPRSASGKGACSTWTAYRQLGVQELKDIETMVRWLAKYPFIDPERIGMSGHSYGGFMTAYALTHSALFAAGIAGAPVTDWRSYDSIYTERYMNTPQENPKGYKASSVIAAAGKLHGKLLLVHGLMDDNVHAHNSMQLAEALQRADKPFELMVYPRNRHGIGGKFHERLMIDFMRRVLRPEM